MKVEKIYSKKDGLELELAIIEPIQEPKGIVQFSHGMSEHKERYYDFMNYLANNGYICVIHDHRGHGASVKEEKDLGYFYTEDISYIVEDLYQVTEYIQEKYKGLEMVMFSHSMGTLIARNYLKKYDDKISKIILCGPPTENNLAGLGIGIAKILKLFYGKNKPNKILNKITFSSCSKNAHQPNEWVCSNSEAVKKYNEDKLCGYIFTTNGFINLYKLMKEAFNAKDWKVKNSDLRIFIIAGEDDPIIQSVAQFNELVEFIKNRGYTEVESKTYEGMRHELLNESNKNNVYEDLLNFIEK